MVDLFREGNDAILARVEVGRATRRALDSLGHGLPWRGTVELWKDCVCGRRVVDDGAVWG